MTTIDTLTGLDSLASSTAITQTNVTPNLSGAPAKTSGSTVNADSAVPSGYTGNAVKISWTTSGGAGDFRVALPATGQSASNVFRMSFYYRTATPTPGGDITFLQLNSNPTTPARTFTLLQRATNAAFRILDSANAASDLTGSGTPAWNTWYRIEVQADNSGGLGLSKLTINVYDLSGTKVVGFADTGTFKLANANVFNEWRLGATGYNTTAGSHAFFGIRWADGGTGEIGPYLPALAGPVVTLGATTNPTTVGGSNGTQVVSWPAVTNATSYDAWLSTATTPNADGSNATKVATGVTSPYTFTGLGAGNYWYGIQANP